MPESAVLPKVDPKSPVSATLSDRRDAALKRGSALYLSGGDYRAMVFHVGVLWRLYEPHRDPVPSSRGLRGLFPGAVAVREAAPPSQLHASVRARPSVEAVHRRC